MIFGLFEFISYHKALSCVFPTRHYTITRHIVYPGWNPHNGKSEKAKYYQSFIFTPGKSLFSFLKEQSDSKEENQQKKERSI